MASFNIHLAVGKLYLMKNYKINEIESEKEFLSGIIEPDLEDDKIISHYSKTINKNNLLEYLSGKVDLIKFLKEEKINNDYQKGRFLHLITDYLFFNEFFDTEYIKELTYENFCRDLYYSYDICKEYIANKYKIDEEYYSSEMIGSIEKSRNEKSYNKEGNNILPFDKLDTFIDIVASINLEDYRSKLLLSNINIKP